MESLMKKKHKDVTIIKDFKSISDIHTQNEKGGERPVSRTKTNLIKINRKISPQKKMHFDKINGFSSSILTKKKNNNSISGNDWHVPTETYQYTQVDLNHRLSEQDLDEVEITDRLADQLLSQEQFVSNYNSLITQSSS